MPLFGPPNIGKLAAKKDIKGLIAALQFDVDKPQSKHWQVRADAAVALGQLGDPQAVDALLVALRDPMPIVRHNAASSLGDIGDPRAIQNIIALIERNEYLQEHLMHALAKIGAPAVQPLINMLKTSQNDIARMTAVGALGLIGDSCCVEAIKQAAENPKEVPARLVARNWLIKHNL